MNCSATKSRVSRAIPESSQIQTVTLFSCSRASWIGSTWSPNACWGAVTSLKSTFASAVDQVVDHLQRVLALLLGLPVEERGELRPGLP